MNRVFIAQYAPPVTAGLFENWRARMAAATGDREALVAHLTALANTRSPDYTFVRHEPMIQPYLKDAEGCGPAGQTGRAPRRVAPDPAEGLDAGADPRRAEGGR